MVAPASLTREDVESDQRQRIFRATAELVAKRGYNDVTVQLIVRRARVSFRTFYNHFGSKEEAFLEFFDATFVAIDRRVRGALSAEPEAPWSRHVAVALRTVFGWIIEEPIIARACIVEGPTAGPSFLGRYAAAGKAFVPLFRAGRELNPHGDQLPATLEETLAGSVLWSAYQRLIIGEVERLEQLLPEVIELVLRPYIGRREAAHVARDAVAGTQSAKADQRSWAPRS